MVFTGFLPDLCGSPDTLVLRRRAGRIA